MSNQVLAPLALSFFVGTAGCAAQTADEDTTEDESTDLVTNGVEYHGLIKASDMGVADPPASMKSKWTWDRDDLVLAAKIDAAHPAHAWDIEITDECGLDLITESIRLAQGGAPDVDGIASRFLFPEAYPVKDVDTTITLFKKEGGSWKFNGKNDDGLNKGKGSYLSRYAKKGSVYRVVIRAKSSSTVAALGLWITGRNLNPPEP